MKLVGPAVLVAMAGVAAASLLSAAYATGETQWECDTWNQFHDWFVDDLAEALRDSARFRIRDTDGVVSVRLLATNECDGGTWEAYDFVRESPSSDWWWAPPPANQIIPGKEIFYYGEATDGVGDTTVSPRGAPLAYRDFSILPINGSVEDPGLLLVDKHGRRVPGPDESYKHRYEYYVREAMDVLGYTYDVYNVEVPCACNPQSNGPDTSGMKYYDTQVWFAGDLAEASLNKKDQYNLSLWLSQADSGKERNLLITGNGIGRWVSWDNDTLDFYSEWLASDYLGCSGFTFQLGLGEEPGGHDFMTYDDGQCALFNCYGGLYLYDHVQPTEGIPGAEIAVRYTLVGEPTLPAGVAHTHAVMGYQTVNLGFGMMFMMEGVEGEQFFGGIEDRVDLIANIMSYFDRWPDAPGTEVSDQQLPAAALGRAHPNPFNPLTTIDYGVAAPGRVTLRVYDLAGRLVRTLVCAERGSGEHRAVWDGTTDSGDRVASGVYFVRMETSGFRASQKLVLLK